MTHLLERLQARRDNLEHAPPSPWARGFSLAEMLVVVAIIGMMVLVTTPAMMNFWGGMKVRTAAHRLSSHLRLCRQVAVSSRATVVMELQRNISTTKPTYTAWIERNGDQARQVNGVDTIAGNDDDETQVIKPDVQLSNDGITFLDSYNDTTPANPSDALGSSIMDGSGIMRIRFYPNGQVAKILSNGDPDWSLTCIRMRMQRRIRSSQTDIWDATINRAGKVGTDFTRGP